VKHDGASRCTVIHVDCVSTSKATNVITTHIKIPRKADRRASEILTNCSNFAP